MALERIPDPVFAQKMVGDGLSIDPTDSILRAPCDAEVVTLHAAHHALTLLTPEGAELLMHVGIDTVTLRGEGFRPRVQAGDKVKAGAPLIEFDLDFLATHATCDADRDTSRDRDFVGARDGICRCGKTRCSP